MKPLSLFLVYSTSLYITSCITKEQNNDFNYEHSGVRLNGALFNQVSVLFVVAVIIVSGLFAYMIVYELRHRGRLYRTKWWLQTKIES